MNESIDKGWRPEAPPLQGRGLGWGLSLPLVCALTLAQSVPATAASSHNTQMPFFLIYNGCASDPTTADVEERFKACRTHIDELRPKLTSGVSSKDPKVPKRAHDSLDRMIEDVEKRIRDFPEDPPRPSNLPVSVYARCLGEAVLSQASFGQNGSYNANAAQKSCEAVRKQSIASMVTKKDAVTTKRRMYYYDIYFTDGSFYGSDYGGEKIKPSVDIGTVGPFQP